jgi:alpha-ketoglutarate-dependent taurine dioxygenase/transcriptional regulator with XRE-family HTH domain
LRGLTGEGLADRANVSYSLLSKVEAGAVPASPALVAALGRALGVSVAVLTGQPYRDESRKAAQLHAVIPAIRREMAGYRLLPVDIEHIRPRPATDLVRAVARVSRNRHAAQLDRMGTTLPSLLAELRAAIHLSSDTGEPATGIDPNVSTDCQSLPHSLVDSTCCDIDFRSSATREPLPTARPRRDSRDGCSKDDGGTTMLADTDLTTAVAPGLGVARVAGHIGAEITGVDLSQPLDAATVAKVRAAMLAHKVIFFRGQNLTHAQHIAFGRLFGQLTRRSRAQSNADLDEYPEILTISPQIDEDRYGMDYEAHYRTRWATYNTGWHTDMTHTVNPPAASILRADVVPSCGGDTHWTNLVAAYEGLSPALRQFVDGLRAEHNFFAGYRMVEHEPTDRRIIDEVNADPRIAVHPVVRVHPETKEKALFVNPSRTARIIGLSPVESRHVLDLLFAQIVRPEYMARFRWEPGSVAFWDNRATAHLAATDVASGVVRVLHRVTLIGDRPVGPDGFESDLVAGRPFGGDPEPDGATD